jgi:oligosaccharide repeat unit polymerase
MSTERILALAVALALAAGCVLEFRRSLRAGEGIVSVLGLFLAVWAISLGLFAIPWIRYDHTSVETWIAIYGSVATFSLGCLAARRRVDGQVFAPATRWREFDPQRLRRLWLGAALLGLIGVCGYIHAVDVVVGWRTIFTNPSLVHHLQGSSAQFKSAYGSFTILTYFNYIGVLLWTIGLRSSAFSQRWRPAQIAGALSVLALLLTANRQLIFILCIWIVVFHLLWRPPVNLGRLLPRLGLAMALLVALFVAVGLARNSSLDSHPEIRRALTTQTAGAFVLPYLYATANVPLLSKLDSDPIRPHTYGEMTILPLVKVAHAARLVAAPPEETGAFYPIPFNSYNSSTWLGPFLLDFGLAGCLLLPLICGFLFTSTVSRAVRGRSLAWIWVASVAVYVTVFSPLNNQLTIALTWELALIGPLIVLLCAEGPGWRDLLRSLHARSRTAPTAIRIGVVAAVVAAVAVLALAHAGIIGPAGPSLPGQIASAVRLSSRTVQAGQLPDSEVLASRLQAAQPAFTYVAVGDPGVPPSEPNVIGVNVAKDTATFVAQSARGQVTELAWSPSADPLLRNGDFSAPLSDGWQSFITGVATIARQRLANGTFAIEVTGTNRAPQGSTELAQTTGLPQDAEMGARYELTMRVKRLRLSQTMYPRLRATYSDGTYESVAMSDAPRNPGTGIPPGSDRIAHTYTTILEAKKPLVDLTVFVVDTGSAAFRGGVQIQQVRLEPISPAPKS